MSFTRTIGVRLQTMKGLEPASWSKDSVQQSPQPRGAQVSKNPLLFKPLKARGWLSPMLRGGEIFGSNATHRDKYCILPSIMCSHL